MNPEPQWQVMPFPYDGRFGAARIEIPTVTVWRDEQDASGLPAKVKTEIPAGIILTIYPSTATIHESP